MKTKKINKKAFANSMIIALVVSLIILLFLFFEFKTMYDDWQYDQSLIECQSFITKIDGKPGFFEQSLDMWSPLLVDSIADKCDAKIISVGGDSTRNAANLIKNCWKKTGSGENFLANKIRGNGICLYCGSIKVDEDFEDFDTNLENTLKKENYEVLFDDLTEVKNMNKATLGAESLPKTIFEDETVSVFYFIYADSNQGITDWLSTSVGSGFASINRIFSYAASHGDNPNTVGGIILSKNTLNEKEGYSDNIANSDQFGACEFIIPNEIHEP